MAGTKLTDKELQEVIKEAYDLRYNQNYTQDRYVKYAKEKYNKSEQQCCQYFLKAKDYHFEVWKDLLEKQLTPAVHELIGLLADDDPKVRQRAVDQIFRYTGQDIQKIQAELKGEVTVSFGNQE